MAKPPKKRHKKAWDQASTGSVNSAGSFTSVTSRCSMGSAASATAVANHDAKLREAVKRGDVDFLVNLLGPKDAICGFLRHRRLNCVPILINGSEKIPKVSREEVQQTARSNWPDEEFEILKMYDTVKKRMDLDKYFTERLMTTAHIDEMFMLCGGQLPYLGDRGLVMLFAECCRRSDSEMLMQVVKRFCITPSNTPDEVFQEMYTRCRVTLEFFLSKSDRKHVNSFAKEFLMNNSAELNAEWARKKKLVCCAVS